MKKGQISFAPEKTLSVDRKKPPLCTGFFPFKIPDFYPIKYRKNPVDFHFFLLYFCSIWFHDLFQSFEESKAGMKFYFGQ